MVVGDRAPSIVEELLGKDAGRRIDIDREVEPALRIGLAHPGAIEQILTNRLLKIGQHREPSKGRDRHSQPRRSAVRQAERVATPTIMRRCTRSVPRA
jgi:hypothetical protein